MRSPIFGLMLIMLLVTRFSTIGYGSQSFNMEPQLTKHNRLEVKIHKITPTELERLKGTTGVWKEGENCNTIFNGHGTGLRAPTEEEWEKISRQAYVFDRLLPRGKIEQTPPSIDHTTSPWFPPIGDQDGEGSCVAWAVGYYTKTFQEAKEHGWNLSNTVWEGGYKGYPTAEYQNRMFSPDFIYHQINGGEDGGSSYFDAINLVCSIGACSWLNMPYDPDDHTSWPSEDAWREATVFRGNNTGSIYMWTDTDQGVLDLKDWIASGNLAVISVDARQYSSMTPNDVWTLDTYVSPSTNHANTIVGYNDDLTYSESGETHYGAFKIANSWGIGGWESVPDGYFWISYEAMKQRVNRCMIILDVIGYKPELVASFRMDHTKRGECQITIGMGEETAPIRTKRFDNWILDGGDHPFCSNDIFLDITEFKSSVPTVDNQSFFLEVYDGGSSETGTIEGFTIEYARCPDTPLNTIDGDYVYSEVILNPFETFWISENLVSSDEDFLDDKISLATDSNGFLYVAYSDLYPTSNHYAIFVRRSTDGGVTWPLITVGYDSQHSMGHPSIAVDPYSNDVFVAVEREWTTNDHDIFVMKCIDGSWSWTPVANSLGSDDRFPSITIEYAYGSANRLYISYEYVYTYNDRDLMFAKSTDHGASWSIMKLHGGWPDYNVHAQTSITNAEGYIYIAYKWGADYDSTCEIRVDVSADYGDSWTQYVDVDGSSGDCCSPSVVATRGNSLVVMAFQYAWSEDDDDVRYSYSYDRGESWYKGFPLFTTFEDERQPALAVDGEGTTETDVRGSLHAVCQAGSFIRYRKMDSNGPSVLTSSRIISDLWVGEGLSIATYMVDSWFCPSIVWTDYRTRNIYHSTPFANIFCVVRGLNNRIYYRVYDSSGDSWDSWNVVPTGATCDSPAAAVYFEKLYIVVRGMDGYSLWFGWINLIDHSFSDWTRLSGATPSAPTLVSYDSQLVLIVRGLNNRIYYRFYNCTSDEWEGWIVVPTGVTCDSPASTILANELHIVIRGISATNSSMWHGRLNLTTGISLGWTRLSGATLSAPTLATLQTLNKLCLTVRGLNNSTYYNTWNGTAWEGWTVVPSGATCDGPASTIIGDELHIVVRGMDGHSLWHYHINLSTNDHSGWTRISGATQSAPTLTS